MFEAMATAHFNMKISRFRCDNGYEYISSEIKQVFESRGIQFKFTIRYTQQQNGIAERMNCTILQKARCMLLNSKLEKVFWSEAVQTAIYLINRSPISSFGKNFCRFVVQRNSRHRESKSIRLHRILETV